MSKSKGKSIEHRWISAGIRALAVPVETLTHDPDNVRMHDERNIDAIRSSLEVFGQQAPIVYVTRGKRKIVIKGNGLLKAARAIGWSHVAAVPSSLKGNAVAAYAIADNRTSDLSEFDADLLAAQLRDLQVSEIDFEATGFNVSELEAMLNEAANDDDGNTADGEVDGQDRKRGPRTVRCVVGTYTFEVERQQYDAWMHPIEAKASSDSDRVIRELRRRLKL